jgi:hypothetical protein
VAEKACHAFASTTQVGLIQALDLSKEICSMSDEKLEQTTLDHAARSAPIFLFAGLIGGLMFGVIFGSIAYGLCAGVMLAIAAWFISTRRRASKEQVRETPQADA